LDPPGSPRRGAIRKRKKIQHLVGEVSLAQLVGGVDVQTQHLSSNPHGHELSFLFILKVGTHVIYLEDYALILIKIKNLSTHAKWLLVVCIREVKFSPFLF
jgi:hypothetical protein